MRTETNKKDGKLWLSGWGNTEGPIMILASHPYQEDLRNGYVLGYAENEEEYNARNELDNAMDAVGLKLEEECWITSVVKYGIGSKDKPSSEQIEECAAELDEEIAEVKPKLIIALGAEAFKRVMKQNIKQSEYVGEIIDSPYGKVLVNYSPAQVFRVDPTLRPEFIANFELAKRFINDDLHYTDYETLVITDPRENEQIIKQCIKEELFTVGYDLEWKGKFLVDERLHSFQYSVTPDQAIVLPLLSPENPTVENLELLNTMKPLLEHDKADRLGWNIRADDKRLILKGFNLKDHTLGFDGMKAVAFFDSRWGKGLEFGIKKFTNYRPYYNKFYNALRNHKLKKEEMSELMFLEYDTFIEYAAGDAVSHREACVNMRKAMYKHVPRHVREYYFNVYLPLTHYITDMELTGVPIDMECMTKLTEQYNECYDKLNARLMGHTKKLLFDTEKYDAAVKELGEEAVKDMNLLHPDFNPRSSKDKTKLFFEKLKLTPQYYVRKGKAKPKVWYDKQKPHIKATFNPSANGKSMSSIRFDLAAALVKKPDDEDLKFKYEIVSDYLDLSRVGVFAKKFLSKQGVITLEDIIEDREENEGVDDTPLKSSYWAALAPDNRIHADFYECLDNFRSSSRPNVQNPASKVLSHMPTIFSKLDLETPKNIRNIFYSGSKDYHFAEVDVAGADLAIAAFLSQDPKYIHDMLAGGFHAKKMREYFKDDSLTKDDASKYVSAKSITFRVAYTSELQSAALPIQAEIYAESGHLVPLDIISYALETWEEYTTYMEYRATCKAQVENEKCISNMRGMKYYFEETSNFGIKAGWLNQSLAYPIASELALFMWELCVEMKKRFIKDNLWMKYIYPVNSVHDASYWVIHKDLMKDNYFPEVCKQYFTKDVKIVTGNNLGMEMIVSDRWKGSQKIFSKETAWNFEKKCWEWAH